MSLVKLVDSRRTDKNTAHTYLPLYQKLLEKKNNIQESLKRRAEKATNLLI